MSEQRKEQIIECYHKRGGCGCLDKAIAAAQANPQARTIIRTKAGDLFVEKNR
jgi:hypothetical protein